MEAFVRVVETGSFSSAARLLDVGQPAISKLVAQLEERLGVRLLLRSTHGLTPTEAGRNFFERAKRALEEADEADVAAKGAGTTLSGTLRVSAAVTFARLHVVPHLGVLLEQNPDLEVEIVLDDGNIDLVQGGIDVALRMGALSDSMLTARKIGENRRLVLASSAYLESYGEPRTPEDLLSRQAVIYNRGGGGTQWTFRKDNQEVSIMLRGRVRVTAAEGVREAVFAGLGFTVASEWMFAPELRSGAVREILPGWKLPSIDLWAIFPTGRRASAKARAFADFIENRLRS
jgi:DNA-binding transcriptional LysR family regulator